MEELSNNNNKKLMRWYILFRLKWQNSSGNTDCPGKVFYSFTEYKISDHVLHQKGDLPFRLSRFSDILSDCWRWNEQRNNLQSCLWVITLYQIHKGSGHSFLTKCMCCKYQLDQLRIWLRVKWYRNAASSTAVVKKNFSN